MKTEYQVTIGYKAVLTVAVKADSEQEAKKIGVDVFSNDRQKMFKGKCTLEDDSFEAHGVLNMDKTWNNL